VIVRQAVPVRVLRRFLLAALLVAPAAALVVLAFAAGGFYPGTTAIAALAALGGLVTWVLLAPDALAGLGRSAAIVLALLAAFAGWTLLSGTWSHSPGLALIEFDRVLLYLAVFALFALAGRTGARARTLIAILAGAALVVAVIGLAAWLFPDHFEVSATFVRRRMSYPTGYWNVTGLLAGLGVVWSLHLASASNEHWALRVAGAAAIAPLVAVIGYTASRGALAATIAGVIVYVLVTRSRAVLVGLVACVPAAVGAFVIVSLTPALSSLNTNGLSVHAYLSAAIAQGHRGAASLVLCATGAAILRAALVPLDRRLPEIRLPRPSRRTAGRAVAAALVALVAVGIAIGAPGRLSRAYRQFSNGSQSAPIGEGRLTSLSSDGRSQLWHVALSDGFAPDPLLGSGAGTYAELWNRYRPRPADALVAASLYIGTLGDLGLVGAALLFSALIAIVLALVRLTRRGGAEGAAWAGLLAGAAAWLVFAVADWSWQMPTCTIWLFAAAGLALSRPLDGERKASVRPERRSVVTWASRIAIAIVAVALALVPRALERSDSSLNRALTDLQHNDCAGAQAEAAASREALPERSEPYMVLAYCAARDGRDKAALLYGAAAAHRDPANWEVYYTEGLVQAAAGRQPRAALHAALLHNPLGSYAIEASARLDGASAGARRQVAFRLPIPLAVSLCGGPTAAAQIAPCGNPSLPTLGPGAPVATVRP